MDIRYGYKKKNSTPFDLFEFFEPFSTIPDSEITCDEDWIDLQSISNFEDTVAEVFSKSTYVIFNH